MDLENYHESTVILKLELINFMCHDHIVIDFKKPFTCIGGRNGSGKSAIMISLGILFGQRSSNLERGNSFRNLIKTGQQFCVIKCVLNNTKKYCYDFFGDFIILEKRLTHKSSSFSITNKQKRLHSNKMEDLEYILDFFNIKLENPLNFLTQEQSKKFLNTADSSNLYKLFLKGTEIADIRLINEKYEKNIQELKNKIDNIEFVVKEINQQLEKEYKRMEILENVNNLTDTIKKDENELRWADVYAIKNQMNILEKEFSDIQSNIDMEQNVHTQFMEEVEDLKSQKDSIFELTQTMKSENKAKQQAIEEAILSTNKKIRNMENEFKDLKESFNIKKDLISRLEKSNTLVDERESLRVKKADIEDKILSERIQQENCLQILNKEKNIKEEQDRVFDEYKKKVYALQKQIEFCKKNVENDLIHPEIKQILQTIKNTKFTEEVIGPIGDYIKLKDQKWWKVASLVLQKFVTSFICFNREDREKLSHIFKTFNVQFSILIPSSKSCNLIKYEKNPNFKVLLDVIECENNIVMNQLIIMANIEEKALIEDRNEAYRVIRKDPKNIDCIYTLNGDIIKKIGGSISDFAPRKIEKYFFEKQRDKHENYQAELNRLMKNKPSVKPSIEYEKISKDYEVSLQTINKYERNLAEIIRQIENAEDLFKAQNEVMNNEEIAESYRFLENQMNLLNNKIAKMKEKLKVLENDKNNITNTQYPSTSEIELKMQKFKVKINIANDSLQKFIQKKRLLNVKLAEKNCEFEIARANLLKEIDEILDPRPKDEIYDEISRIKIEIEETKKIGNKEETQEKINSILEKKQMNENILNLNKHKINDVCESFMQRITKREEIKEFIGHNASKRFEELTLQRGYKGELIFDHENEKLHIKLEVHNFGIAGSKETLSGGERSFAAMSLLFSLWPYISCPVIILDEFDVFMDDLNRKYIINKFVEYFRKSQNQVILITPLNTKDLEDKNVDILILNPPRD